MTAHEPTVELMSPATCSEEEYDQFRKMVLEAGEVEEAGLDGRIRSAEALAFLQLGGVTIGVGALKFPNPSHARKVFEKAGTKQKVSTFGLELGWVVIEGSYRGRSFSRRIVETLVKRAAGKKIYATSVTTRIRMHKALTACGFHREGVEWPSQRRPEEELVLFIHSGRSR
jgi:GNAT superfamily N-acetyltransferase